MPSSDSNPSTFPPCIVSGGQTGADRAGLDFAIAHGLLHAGFCPAERRSEDGRIPEIYNLIETESPEYLERTRKNVRLGDVTIIFCTLPLETLRKIRMGSGSAFTMRECERQARPYLVLAKFPDAAADAAELTTFLTQHAPRVLNVAGARESKTPGISAHVRAVLSLVAEKLPKPQIDPSYSTGEGLKHEARRIEQLAGLARSASQATWRF